MRKYNDLTDEQLLQFITDYYKQHHKTPPANYMTNKNKMPTLQLYYKRFNTKSWLDILKICGLTPRYQYYSKEEGLSILRNTIKKIGKIPTQKDFGRMNMRPSYKWYIENFGSMFNALNEIGIINLITDEEKEENSIKFYQSLAKKKEDIVTRSEYEKLRDKDKTFCYNALLNRLQMNSKQFAQCYANEYTCVKDLSNITTEEVIKDIKILEKKLKHIPMQKEMFDIGYNGSFFQKKYGGYIKFLKDNNIEPYIQREIKTDKELLDDFLKLYKQLGRVPNLQDLKSQSDMCSYKAYFNHFGNLTNVCKILGIDYSKDVANCGYGTLLYDKHKNLCRSLIEYRINNYFIDNNIKFDKEYNYDNVIPNCKMIFDWKIRINNEDYYLEYFGLYTPSNIKNKVIKRYMKNTKKKIKLLYKNNLIDKSIFLFPKDYQQKLISFVESKIGQATNINSFNRAIINKKLTDEDILDTLMSYSNDSDMLPSYSIIKKYKLFHYYEEILKRYDNYENFGKKYNKKTHKRHKTKATEQTVFGYMSDMIYNYDKIISIQDFKKLSQLEKKKYRGYYNYISSHGGMIKVKLRALENMIKNKQYIGEEEKTLSLLSQQKFPYCGYPQEYYKKATQLLQRLKINNNELQEVLT